MEFDRGASRRRRDAFKSEIAKELHPHGSHQGDIYDGNIVDHINRLAGLNESSIRGNGVHPRALTN